jgi:hypothetical protein
MLLSLAMSLGVQGLGLPFHLPGMKSYLNREIGKVPSGRRWVKSGKMMYGLFCFPWTDLTQNRSKAATLG